MSDKRNIGVMAAGPFHLNLPSLFEMSAAKLRSGGEGRPSYNQEMVFKLDVPEQKAAIAAIQAKALEVVKAEFGPDATLQGVPDGAGGFKFKFRAPWKSGDKKKAQLVEKGKSGDLYTNTIFVRASTYHQPAVGKLVGNEVVEGVTASEMYSGCLCMSEVNIVAKPPIGDDEDSKGYIKLYLNGTVKTAEGERWGGRSSKQILSGLMGATTETSVDDGEEDDGLVL